MALADRKLVNVKARWDGDTSGGSWQNAGGHNRKRPSEMPKGVSENTSEQDPDDYTRPLRITRSIVASIPETSRSRLLGSGVGIVPKYSCGWPSPAVCVPSIGV